MATVDPPDDLERDHLEFEQLAVQHVLGGLEREASSRFRGHLAHCPACRQRVVELRGIAADLESAAREERALARTKLETARREPPPEPPRRAVPGGLQGVRALLAMVALSAILAFAFWNVHLQSVRRALEASLAERGAVLDTIVAGTLVEAQVSAAGLRAVVAVDGQAVAIDASGVPPVPEDQRIVLWSVDDEGDHRLVAFVGPGGSPDGRVVMHVDGVGGVAVVLSLEQVPVGDEPSGPVVLRADLP